MLCQTCNKNPASVHVTEILEYRTHPEEQPHSLVEKHLCASCVDVANLPVKPAPAKTIDIWKLLQQSALSSKQSSELTCNHCSMTLREFRSHGRLGCMHCYEVFARHLTPLLHRMHNSLQHVGRLPGVDAVALDRMQRLHSLEQELVTAVREEAYENAARLRDEIEALRSS